MLLRRGLNSYFINYLQSFPHDLFIIYKNSDFISDYCSDHENVSTIPSQTVAIP